MCKGKGGLHATEHRRRGWQLCRGTPRHPSASDGPGGWLHPQTQHQVTNFLTREWSLNKGFRSGLPACLCAYRSATYLRCLRLIEHAIREMAYKKAVQYSSSWPGQAHPAE
ncbi:unnamed protein product, partial [Pylaiella littoralis]